MSHRSGAGLTTRPQPGAWRLGEPSPYSQQGQAYLILRLCEALGIQQATLVGHSDGCLPVITAAAATRYGFRVSAYLKTLNPYLWVQARHPRA